MFEKEAEEYTLKRLVGLEDFDSYQSAYDRFENGVQDAFKDGAEYGYNKANEWHYVKDGDLPKEEDLVLFKTDVDYYIGKIDYSKKCWWTGVCRDESICNSFVIAWCEIPKYTEE